MNHSSEIHLFKIGTETGIAAGVRRMIAYTSKGAFDYLRARDRTLQTLRDATKSQTVDELPSKVERLMEGERALRKQIEQIQAKAAAGEADSLLGGAKAFGGGRLVTAIVAADSTGVKKLRDLAEVLRNKAPDSVLVLGMSDAGKANLLISVGTKVTPAMNANELMKQLSPLIEGRGGGKPDLAQAGGTNPAGLDSVMKSAQALILK